ncbi:MAG: MATE family efflux transporter [Spirochaetia bacterium]|nr:MATE family efflux transporter [Spirochaetia bacterium]
MYKKLTVPGNQISLLSKNGILRDKSFYIAIITLALPIMLQNLLAASLSFVDTVMVGQLGEVKIAAVGLANQMFFLVILIFFGISSGASIFFAQFWGDKDIKSIHKTLGLALTIGISCAAIISIVSIFLPEKIMRIFSPDKAVISVGAEYLKIVGISYTFSAVTYIFSAALRSTEDARTPLIVSAISMTTNAIFNYLLIFGKFGFPQMGVRGAAVATTGSRALEMCLIIAVSYIKKKPTAAPLAEIFSFTKEFTAKFFKLVSPVILNEMAWSFGMVMYKIVFSRMGTSIIASANISESIQSLFFVVFVGTANSAAILIGKKIGEKNQKMAKSYASGFLVLGLCMGVVVGGLMASFSSLIPRVFNAAPEILSISSKSLLIMSMILPIKVFNMHSIVGVLRSGGDTRFSLILEITSVWCVGVPLAFIGGLILHIPIYYLYGLVGLEEVYKLIIGARRIRSGKWINDLTETHLPAEPIINSLSGTEIS